MRVPIRVAVVGAGPKGTIMLNRPCANARRLADAFDLEVPRDRPVSSRERASLAHRSAGFSLLMNTPARDATVFVDVLGATSKCPRVRTTESASSTRRSPRPPPAIDARPADRE